jgi:hypothetical protein
MSTLHEDLHAFLHPDVTWWGIPLSFAKVKFWPKCQDYYAMHTFPNLLSEQRQSGLESQVSVVVTVVE